MRAAQGLCSTWRGPPAPGCRVSLPLPLTLTWALPGSSPRELGRALELDPLLPHTSSIWGLVKGWWPAGG